VTRHDDAIAVRVPASSANLGPGFDVLGMALDLYADVGTGVPPDGAHVADHHHPAADAFSALGGTGEIWVRTRIPMSRGLGYSGAVRVGGAALAALQRGDEGAGPELLSSADVLATAVALEGHGDNAAASQRGGVTIFADGTVTTVDLGFTIEPRVVTWIPRETTMSTNRSRAALDDLLPRADVTFNLANVATLVVALQRGDVNALAGAMRDRLHQGVRLAGLPESAKALEQGVDAGAWCGWLSGSGPTVAFLCAAHEADHVAASLGAGGTARTLRIDHEGVRPLAPGSASNA
jgi:homoserine kinase